MTEAPPTAEGGRRYLGFFVLAAVVAAIAVVLVSLPNDNQAPFTPPQANPKLVGYQVLMPADSTGTNISTALRRLGGSADNNIALPTHRDEQYVIGRVNVAGQVATDAEYEVIVVDNRLHRVAPLTFSYPEPGQSARTGQGWDSADGSLDRQYDWQPTGSDQAAFFEVDKTTSFVFWARLPSDTNPVVGIHTDLSVVLALTNGSNHVYWSQKLS